MSCALSDADDAFASANMSNRANKIVQAWMDTPTTGVCELDHDWKARQLPPVRMSGGLSICLSRVKDHSFGNESGYFITRRGMIYFFVPREVEEETVEREAKVYLAGDFNGWGDAIGNEDWLLKPATLDGRPVLIWCGEAKPFISHPPQRFKFVTESGHWMAVPASAKSTVIDEGGNRNRIIDGDRSGLHLFRFELNESIDPTKSWRLHWQGGESDQSVPVRPGKYFHDLITDLLMGAVVEREETVFRLFAPRAQRIELCLQDADDETAAPKRYDMVRRTSDELAESSVWELSFPEDLHGTLYWYHIAGPQDEFSLFDSNQRVLDPYAKAALGREGPGIVVNAARIERRLDGFKTPAWQDLVICEAHVRDLAAMAPVDSSEAERQGFAGLRKWVDAPASYLSRLGVNCVELQPIQEFDNEAPEDYHWGYMTNNYFSPESSYALEPRKLSGIGELQELVSAFHRRGIAVVLDVVYNHVGVPGHLMLVDKLYYFTVDEAGELSNWSGCGNDLRADAAMATKLIIDSCRHLMETYGVDGFRFDLAELLGTEVLKKIEVALKRVKPDVILIAEPWSFRGHIANELAETGWASWNDGYRRFLKDYVRGGTSHETFEYYFKGSPWHFAHWPAQTVNYVESHDDRTWIDEITENPDGSGHLPTANDRRRTHLMAAVLFGSIGIPMISAGQDFMRSKHGVNNTYLRGDLNALDYRRMDRFSATHAYFADWIGFRKSESGRLLRHFSRATETFFQFWFVPDSVAVAVLFNADLSQGSEQLLFAINPQLDDVEVVIDKKTAARSWTRIADQERFTHQHEREIRDVLPNRLWLPALGCGLWQSRG